ncbi:MAG: fibronectin, type III domain-containing protein, partial [Candidatus Magnetoglobus multicellularis str. Araruama]
LENSYYFIKPVNDAPVCIFSTQYTNEDNSLSDILHASDSENDPLTFEIVQYPQNGVLHLTDPENGLYQYLPDRNFFGTDRFTFKANDANVSSESAELTIIIHPVNDAPVSQPFAITTNEDAIYKGQLAATDIDQDQLSFHIDQQPQHGSVIIMNSLTGEFQYMPQTNINGVDLFSFSVSDGHTVSTVSQVDVQIIPVNDPPISLNDDITLNEDQVIQHQLLANDVDSESLSFTIVSQTEKGMISLDASTGIFTYTPFNNVYGMDQFSFQAGDGSHLSNNAVIHLNIQPVDDPPGVENMAYTINEDSLLSANLFATTDNDSPLEYGINQMPEKGTLQLVDFNKGSFIYKPFANVNGSDQFSYYAKANQLESSKAIVHITIAPVNDPPVASSQEIELLANVASAITMTGKDIDNDQSQLTYTIINAPQHGTISGTEPFINYVPDEDYIGFDVIKFVVNDSKNNSSIASLLLYIGLPTADIITVEDTLVHFDISAQTQGLA